MAGDKPEKGKIADKPEKGKTAVDSTESPWILLESNQLDEGKLQDSRLTETGIHSKKLSILVIFSHCIQKNSHWGRFSFSCRFFPPRIRVICRTSDQLL